MLHAEHADAIAGRQTRIRIGHVQTDALLAHDHGADVLRGGRFDQRIHRVREQYVDALGLERLGDRLDYFHDFLRQRPLNTGSRFSTNARDASR